MLRGFSVSAQEYLKERDSMKKALFVMTLLAGVAALTT
jgi:hypothetical protein